MRVLLKHHHGWKEYDIPAAKSLEEAAYLAVRESHTFLTDTNHTYTAGERQTTWAGKTITWNSVHIFRGEGAPAYSGPKWLETDYWFATNYAAPTVVAEDGAVSPTELTD